jgi:hypothetical protein
MNDAGGRPRNSKERRLDKPWLGSGSEQRCGNCAPAHHKSYPGCRARRGGDAPISRGVSSGHVQPANRGAVLAPPFTPLTNSLWSRLSNSFWRLNQRDTILCRIRQGSCQARSWPPLRSRSRSGALPAGVRTSRGSASDPIDLSTVTSCDQYLPTTFHYLWILPRPNLVSSDIFCPASATEPQRAKFRGPGPNRIIHRWFRPGHGRRSDTD